MTRVIFLDIDGVLNTNALILEHGCNTDYIDPGMVARLNRIIEATGAEIVVSSDWRFYDDTDNLLLTAGVIQGRKLSRKHENRVEAMDAFLASNPDVKRSIIIDDTAEYFSADSHGWKLVLTDKKVGLADADVERAIWLLTEQAA